jgi:hypothetical protein
MPESSAEQETFRPPTEERQASRAVSVGGGREDERACMVPAPLTNESRLCLCAALVVDVGLGPRHSTPEAGQAGIEEPGPSHAPVSPIGFQDSDPADLLIFRLAVIQDHEADAVTPPNELFGEQDLLALGPATFGKIRSSR